MSWARTPEAKEKKRVYNKEHRLANLIRYREYDRSRKIIKSSQQRIWRKNNPEVKRQQVRRFILRKHGLSEVEYFKLFQKQSGCCAICKLPESKKRAGRIVELAIDHNHINGKIRGLLCSKCNTALGLLNDSIELILAAGIYLESNR